MLSQQKTKEMDEKYGPTLAQETLLIEELLKMWAQKGDVVASFWTLLTMVHEDPDTPLLTMLESIYAGCKLREEMKAE